MVSEASCAAAGFQPDVLAGYATHPDLAQALRRNRFRASGSSPIHYWSRDRELRGPLWFCGSWGDGPLLPYPARWWGDPAAAPSRDAS
jgi:hypothetical protein